MPEKFRPAQQAILQYQGGWMGISAVPGSGKTFTLSALAAEIIRRGGLESDQEVLVVTLVNSAVDNFSRRVATFLKDVTILPGMSYRVRTLHGLAHDIIRQRPAMVGLASDFAILDEHAADQILTQAVQTWIAMNANELPSLIDGGEENPKFAYICKNQLPNVLKETALAFIRTAKDRQISPEQLARLCEQHPGGMSLARLGVDIYFSYQRARQYRNGLDFDDLIRFALTLLQEDPLLVERLRHQFPYILEDEAQDSSRLQEEILRLLAGRDGNWVRVGDPNQAIFETFTTASPMYLRNFIREQGVVSRPLPASGRSARKIIRLANYLIDWTMNEHPNPEVHSALAKPYIEPVAADDASPNPPDETAGIITVTQVYPPDSELDKVARSVKGWLDTHADETVAILSQNNRHMESMAAVLEVAGVPYVELLRSTSTTRQTASQIAQVLRYLADPVNAKLCQDCYKTWKSLTGGVEADAGIVKRGLAVLKKQTDLFTFFHPPGMDALDNLADDAQRDAPALDDLREFRLQIRKWLEATLLPVDQTILTIAQDLFSDPADLALAHKLASYLNQMSRLHPEWRLPEYVLELATFAGYARKLPGFSREDEGFDPDQYRGKVVLATLHKAKGLEWDKVYLTSVNNFDFPSGAATDEFLSEKWFIRNRWNLTAEALAELDALLGGGQLPRGEATLIDRNKLIGERLRLLYVGITRARRELVITCNSGLRNQAKAAVALTALDDHLRGQS